MGLARIPAKLEVSSEALTFVTVPPETSAIAPRFSRSQASLSTETTSMVTPLAADCTARIRCGTIAGNAKGKGGGDEHTGNEQENLVDLTDVEEDIHREVHSKNLEGVVQSSPSGCRPGNRESEA